MALRGTLTHWKTRLLAQKLGVQPWSALGLLEALWHVTAELAPAGNIGRLPNKAIAMEMFYEGDADALIEALMYSGHLDTHPTHRLTIHDWSQHSDYNTRRKVTRRGELMADGNAPRLGMTRHESIPVPEPVPEPEPEPEPVKKQKPSRDKRETTPPDLSETGISTEVYESYLAVRKQHRAPFADETARETWIGRMRKRYADGWDTADMLSQMVSNGWRGPVEEKWKRRGSAPQKQAPQRELAEYEKEWLQAKAEGRV